MTNTTMLDCIKRCAPLSKEIIDNLLERTQPLVDYLGSEINNISRIYMVGAGSSNNAAVTVKEFFEKVTKVGIEVVIPNIFNNKVVYDKDGLYIFTSQTGTSTLVKDMVSKMNNLGYHTVAICESAETPISKEAKCFVDMGSGIEEYWYRTIGYVTSVVTLMAIALRLGLERKTITKEEYEAYIEDANKAIANHPIIVDKTLAWYEKVGHNFKDARSIIYYGSGCLYGVAIEGALKVLETSKTYLGVGYEMEDGLHGPVLGYSKDDVIITLNNGNADDWMVQGLAKFGKCELGKAYIAGSNTQDDTDLPFDVASNDFRAIEFAPVVEILAYNLALTAGVPVEDAEHAKEHVSSQYFETHRG